MGKKKWVILLSMLMAGISLGWGTVQDRRQAKRPDGSEYGVVSREAKLERIKKQHNMPALRRAAAQRYKQIRARALAKELAKGTLLARTSAAPLAPLPLAPVGSVPHFFGPFPNYASSPVPRGPIASAVLMYGGTGYVAPTVVVEDVYGTGSGAQVEAVLDPVFTGVIKSLNLINRGSNYSAPVAYVVDAAGTGAEVVISIGGAFANGLRQFVDALNHLNSDRTTGTVADAIAAIPGPFTGGIRKFVDRLAGLNPAGANGLGQYIPVAVPEHDDLSGVRLLRDRARAVQREAAFRPSADDSCAAIGRPIRPIPTVSAFHYLGPLIVAQRNRAVRIKFTNNLPTGAAGDLFIPVDTTLMGAGDGPRHGTEMLHPEPRRPSICTAASPPGSATARPTSGSPRRRRRRRIPRASASYNVPDMPDPGDRGRSMTFYYTNQQSARLMFYHDHAVGITRLNVYAGEAAGYLLTDAGRRGPDQRHERRPASIPTCRSSCPDIGIPLVIQDKTFVDAATIAAQDPTWNWGSTPGTPDHRRPVDAACLHAEPEPSRPRRHERLRPLALRPLVLAADDEHRPSAPSRIPTTGQRALGEPRTVPARPIRPWPWKPSWTRRSSTARSIRTWMSSRRPIASAS